jgi:hypothetical protein
MKIDIISPLKSLKQNAQERFSPITGQPSDFVQGYLMAINHALELAELQQIRIEAIAKEVQ